MHRNGLESAEMDDLDQETKDDDEVYTGGDVEQ